MAVSRGSAEAICHPRRGTWALRANSAAYRGPSFPMNSAMRAGRGGDRGRRSGCLEERCVPYAVVASRLVALPHRPLQRSLTGAQLIAVEQLALPAPGRANPIQGARCGKRGSRHPGPLRQHDPPESDLATPQKSNNGDAGCLAPWPGPGRLPTGVASLQVRRPSMRT